MPDTFTRALLAALNASADVMMTDPGCAVASCKEGLIHASESASLSRAACDRDKVKSTILARGLD